MLFEDVDVLVDLDDPLGVSLTNSARIDSLQPDGPFSSAGAKPGDRMVAVGNSLVFTLDDLKVKPSLCQIS